MIVAQHIRACTSLPGTIIGGLSMRICLVLVCTCVAGSGSHACASRTRFKYLLLCCKWQDLYHCDIPSNHIAMGYKILYVHPPTDLSIYSAYASRLPWYHLMEVCDDCPLFCFWGIILVWVPKVGIEAVLISVCKQATMLCSYKISGLSQRSNFACFIAIEWH